MAGMRVLLAEDDVAAAETLGALLASQGHNVVGRAVDGEEAIHLTRRLRPDVVLMDIVLPKLDGIEATRRISEQRLAAVVMLTGYEDEDLFARASQAGAMSYLVKPADRQTMSRAVVTAAERFRDLRREQQRSAHLRSTCTALRRQLSQRPRAASQPSPGRRRAAKEEPSSLAGLSVLLESLPVGVVLLGVDGQFTIANPAAEALLGCRLQGEPLEVLSQCDLLHPSGEPYPLHEVPLLRALRDGQTCCGEEMVVRRSDGSNSHVLLDCAPVVGPDGRVTSAVGALLDVTPIREAERDREEFISMVAHELRTPATVINGFASVLQRHLPPDEEHARERVALGNILSSSRRLVKLICDLLDASRIETQRLSVEKEMVDLPGLVASAVERMSSLMSGRCVRVLVKGGVPPVEVDPLRLEQVIANLLSNAAKYSYPGTEVLVEVEGAAGEQSALVSVTNRGQGIPPEEQPAIFTRFHRARQAFEARVPGLGLGLYIAKGLVEAHGGRIWVESQPGEQTTFRFTLPAA